MSNIIKSKSGMTLIELLVVLALLAGLATFALTSMDDLSARSRYDVTVERMKRVDLLIRGDGITPGRFVSDMGRLPNSLDELFDGTRSFEAKPYQTVLYGTVVKSSTLFCGWNGPYLVPNGTTFYDGFGNTFQYVNDGTGARLMATNLNCHASWLPDEITNTYDSVSNCVLRVQVMAKSVGLIWAKVEDVEDAQSGGIDEIQTYIVGGVHSNGDLVSYGTNCYCYTNETPSSAIPTDTAYWTLQNYSDGDGKYVSYVSNLYYYSGSSSGGVLPGYDSSWEVVDQHNYSTDAKVVLAVPNVGNDPEVLQFSLNITTANPCTFTNLVPGVREIMAYGYNDDGTTITNAWWSGFQTVEIRPGMNFIKLYLTERIE